VGIAVGDRLRACGSHRNQVAYPYEGLGRSRKRSGGGHVSWMRGKRCSSKGGTAWELYKHKTAVCLLRIHDCRHRPDDSSKVPAAEERGESIGKSPRKSRSGPGSIEWTDNFACPNTASTDARQPTCLIKRQAKITIEIPPLSTDWWTWGGEPFSSVHGNPSTSCAFLRAVLSETAGRSAQGAVPESTGAHPAVGQSDTCAHRDYH